MGPKYSIVNAITMLPSKSFAEGSTGLAEQSVYLSSLFPRTWRIHSVLKIPLSRLVSRRGSYLRIKIADHAVCPRT